MFLCLRLLDRVSAAVESRRAVREHRALSRRNYKPDGHLNERGRQDRTIDAGSNVVTDKIAPSVSCHHPLSSLSSFSSVSVASPIQSSSVLFFYGQSSLSSNSSSYRNVERQPRIQVRSLEGFELTIAARTAMASPVSPWTSPI